MSRTISSAVLVGALLGTMATEGGESISIPIRERQLFLDDHLIEETVHLERTVHQPVKKGAVIRPNYTEGEKNVQSRTAPVWDPESQSYKLLVQDKLYSSTDGLHWQVFARRKSKTDPWPKHMLYDASDPDPQRRYKGLMMVALFKVEEMLDDRGRVLPGKELRWELQPLVSGDGASWTKLNTPGVLCKDETNLSYDPKTQRYIVVVKTRGRYGRSHAIATSQDFEHWTEPELVFQADELDQYLNRDVIRARMADPKDPRLSITSFHDPAAYKVDVYNFGVFRYESLYIGMPAIHPSVALELDDLSNNIAYKHLQLTCSRDLREWTRVGERQMFLDVSPPNSGAYDLAQIFPPSWPIVRGDELWLYYSGGKYAAWPPTDLDHKYWRLKRRVAPEAPYTPEPSDPDRGAICLAVLRRDGFVSLDAGEREGSVITKPLRTGGTKLFVNAKLAEGGELRVAILDASGLPIDDGLTIDRCVPVTGDQMAAEISWKDSPNLSLAGRDIRLRISLRDGELYSFWFE